MENKSKEEYLKKINHALSTYLRFETSSDLSLDDLEEYLSDYLNAEVYSLLLDSTLETVCELLQTELVENLSLLNTTDFFLVKSDILSDLTLILNDEYEIQEVEEFSDDDIEGICKLCERELRLTRHHLIPRTLHKKYLKRGYEKEVLNKTVDLCRECHSNVHRLISNEMLGEKYYSLELLLENERIKKFLPWIRKRGVPKGYLKS